MATPVNIGITMGDASGVGPEIVLKAWAEGQVPPASVTLGDLAVLDLCNRRLSLGVPLRRTADPDDVAPGVLNVLDFGLLQAGDLRVGERSLASGRAALAYVDRATRLALAGRLKAIVTLPMNKEATRLSTPGFTGHTEYIAELCGATRITMMLASARLLVTHVSTHVSMLQAVTGLNVDRIHEVIALTADAVQRLGRNPRIAVLGLNPHAGEGGAFGREEIDCIRPAVELARREGVEAIGPLPPDTVFAKALRGEFGAVVCMYHDQGHITMKTIGFEEAVNVTLGLPIVRTSVDHGTAFDIAWKGLASTHSFIHACGMADQLTASARPAPGAASSTAGRDSAGPRGTA